MKTIIKKILPEWFNAIQNGTKDYELRLADFDVQEGDVLVLEEWVGSGVERKATGRVLEKNITHVRKVDLSEWINQQPELTEKGFYVIRF